MTEKDFKYKQADISCKHWIKLSFDWVQTRDMICPGQMLKDIDHDHEIVNVLEVAMNDEIV